MKPILIRNLVFAQLFHLLKVYSLMKPIRGSNITGGQLLSSLFDMNDPRGKTADERKEEN